MTITVGPLKVGHLYDIERSHTASCHTQKGSIAARSGTSSASRISSETASGSNLHSLNLRLWRMECGGQKKTSSISGEGASGANRIVCWASFGQELHVLMQNVR
jgi:hypothetical protein